MGGNLAMSVTCHGLPTGSCPQVENEFCQYFAQAFVRAASGVVAGTKPVSLFSCPAGQRDRIGCSYKKALELLEIYNTMLPHYGIQLEIIECSKQRLLLFVWRRDLVTGVLNDKVRSGILSRLGYDISSPELLIEGLCERIERYCTQTDCAFPHEIGLVFGYPVSDVIGFMSGAKATCYGPWVSFGDPATARQQFDLFRRSEKEYRKQFASGVTLATLILNRK